MPPSTSTMAKELLQTGKTGSDSQSQQSTSVVSPKDQLLYLAQLLDFKVQFSDFPKVRFAWILVLWCFVSCGVSNMLSHFRVTTVNILA
jgi:hypothetical protein